MPQNFGNLTLDLGDLPVKESKCIPIKCPWTTSSKNESLAVIMTCLKWTFNYDFCVRVTAYPQGAPNVSKQKTLRITLKYFNLTPTKDIAFSLLHHFFLLPNQLFGSIFLSYFYPANVCFVLRKKSFFDEADK